MTATIRTVETAADLWDLLEEGNTLGNENGVCLPSRAADGTPFLASLAEEGGDSTVVVYIRPDELGHAWGNHRCEECGCGAGMVLGWEPKFPISCYMSADAEAREQNPDALLSAIVGLARHWRLAASGSERGFRYSLPELAQTVRQTIHAATGVDAFDDGYDPEEYDPFVVTVWGVRKPNGVLIFSTADRAKAYAASPIGGGDLVKWEPGATEWEPVA